MRLYSFPAAGEKWDSREYVATPVEFKPELKKLSQNEWEFTVDKLPAKLCDVEVAIRFIGSTGDLLVDGKKYTDIRYNGTSWIIGLNRFFRPDRGPHTFRVKVAA